MTKATSQQEITATSDTLYVGFELSHANWKLGFSVGLGQRARERNVPAGAAERLTAEIAAAKRRFQLPATARVCSCYEAGRDGFWIHRLLTSLGIENVVVDSTSFEVARRRKRAKTDRIDVAKLLQLLIRYHLGERKVWSVVRVPTVEVEDQRHLERELDVLTRERTRHVNRIRALLVTVGVRDIKFTKTFVKQLNDIRLWDGSRLPPALHCRLIREWERIQRLEEQRLELRQERATILEEWESPEADQIRRLASLRGIGVGSAWLFVMEMFAWRELKNRRQVGAIAGLAPTPFASGELNREQGISKAGNKLSESESSNWHGAGYGSSLKARSAGGSLSASQTTANACAASASSRLPESSWSHSGGSRPRESCPKTRSSSPPKTRRRHQG